MEGIRDFLQYLRHGIGDQGRGMKLNHAVLIEILKDLVKVAMVIVNNKPSNSPSGHNVDLR